MARFGKDKIALFLACASILGGKTSLAAVKPNSVGGAVNSSKKMSSLAKGFTIGGLLLGAGLLGYEVLGDTVIDKAPTLLKLIRGKNQEKTGQKLGDKTKKNFGPYYEQNWQKIKALNTTNDKETNYLIEMCQEFVELTNEKEWLAMIMKIEDENVTENNTVKDEFKKEHGDGVEDCIKFLRGDAKIYDVIIENHKLHIELSDGKKYVINVLQLEDGSVVLKLYKYNMAMKFNVDFLIKKGDAKK